MRNPLHFLALPSLPLLRKELRLQRPTLLLGAAWTAILLALLGLSFVPTSAMFGAFTARDLIAAGFYISATFLVPMIPIFAGICATIPERRSGALDWQAALPVSRHAQWAAKLGATCAVVLAVEAVPLALFGYLLQTRLSPDARLPPAWMWGVFALLLLLGTLAAAWIASLCRETLPALGGVVLFALATAATAHFLDSSLHALPWLDGELSNRTREHAATAILVGGIALGLFLLGASNWRFAPAGRLRALAQGALWLVIFAGSIVLSIRVRHGLDPLVGLEPIPSKGLTPLLGSRAESNRAFVPGMGAVAVTLSRPFDGPVWREPGTDRLATTFAVSFARRRWDTPYFLGGAGNSVRGGQLVEVDARTGAIDLVPGRIGAITRLASGGDGVWLAMANSVNSGSYRFGWFRSLLPEYPRSGAGRADEAWGSLLSDVPPAGIVGPSGEPIAPGSPGNLQVRLGPDSRFVAVRTMEGAHAKWFLTRPDSDPSERLDQDRLLVALDSWEDPTAGDWQWHPWLATSDDAWFLHQPWIRFRRDTPREASVLRSADGSRAIPLDPADGATPAALSFPEAPTRSRPRLRVGSEPSSLPVSPDGRWLVLGYSKASEGNWRLPPLLDHEAFRERVNASDLGETMRAAPWRVNVRWDLRAVDLRSGEIVPLGPLESRHPWYRRMWESGAWSPSPWLLDALPTAREPNGMLEGLRVPVAWSPGGTLAVLHQDRLHLYRSPDATSDAASGAAPEPIAEIALDETRSDDLHFIDDDTLILLGRYSIWRMDVKAVLAGSGA